MPDHLCTLLGLRPWRCRTCESRFYAWRLPPSYIFYAHCMRCGSLDLRRTASERAADGWRGRLGRLLHLPAYHCEPCRHRFFSLRPFHPIVPTRPESVHGPTSAP